MQLRLKQHEASALKVAKWLKEQPRVGLVLHPALPDCPGHEYWARDFKGSSGLFSFELHGDAAAFVDTLELFGMGYSWGGFESLIIPSNPSRHRTATPWTAAGPLLRIHAGLEHPDDMIADLAAGFARMRAAAAALAEA